MSQNEEVTVIEHPEFPETGNLIIPDSATLKKVDKSVPAHRKFVNRLLDHGFMSGFKTLVLQTGSGKEPAPELAKAIYGTFVFVPIVTSFAYFMGWSIWLYFIPAGIILWPAACMIGLVMQADAMAKSVESNLPEALQFISSNLKSGLTTDKAVLLASEENYGRLNDLLKRVGKKVAVGIPIEDSLADSIRYVRSSTYKDSMELVVSTMKSGGQLAEILYQTANDMKKHILMKSKINTSVTTYLIYIMLAVTGGGPFLFGLSNVLVKVLSEKIAGFSLDGGMGDTMGFSMAPIDISETFLMWYSLVSIATTVCIGAMITGLIGSGNERAGFKNIPFMLAGGFILYFATKRGLMYFLGGI